MVEMQSDSEDDVAIRHVMESWTAAVRRRDIGGILLNHSSDIVMFDVPPPFQAKESKPTGRRGTYSFPGRASRFLSI